MLFVPCLCWLFALLTEDAILQLPWLVSGSLLAVGNGEGMMSGLGRWGEWCEKQLTAQVSKSTTWKWLWFSDYLVERQGSISLPELCLYLVVKQPLSVGWRLTGWPVSAVAGQAQEGGSTSLAWEEMTGVLWREKRHGTFCVSNREAQCCGRNGKGMKRKWAVQEVPESMKRWGLCAVLSLPTKFCVSFLPFCSLWACSRS